MNLHDWIDELCDALDIDAEVDEGLVLDLARVAAHNVKRPAAPLTTYLLGVAVGLKGASPEAVEELAERARELAEGWDRPHEDSDGSEDDDDLPEVELEESEVSEESEDEVDEDEVDEDE